MPRPKLKPVTQPADPTAPYTPITIAGAEYRMCLDAASLFAAEEELVALGHNVNLLYCMPRVNASNTRILFAMSLRRYHPEIGFEDAKKLVGLGELWEVAFRIQEEWKKSFPEPVKAHPPKPNQ